MTHRGQKYLKARKTLDRAQELSIQEGVARVKQLAYARFDESVDVNVNVGIDPTKGEQAIRGSVVLPHGTGRRCVVVAFAKGDHAEAALKAGADYVGADDLIERIESGWADFTYAVATPDLMGLVGKVAKFLGPRGLLPNRKNGTVTFDVADVIADLKRGRQFFKNDKNGIVHFSVGKVSFSAEQLQENFNAFLKALVAAKPASAKGAYLRRITVSSTMGPGVRISSGEV
jgi:large subunit ribosomal protein L1